MPDFETTDPVTGEVIGIDGGYVEEVPFGVDDNGQRVPPRFTLESVQEKWLSKGLTADGAAEVPDDTVIAPPVGYKKQPSLFDQVRKMVHDANLQRELDAAGMETFEEADDFDIEDDLFPQSVYELPDDVRPMEAPGSPSEPSGADREPAEQVAGTEPAPAAPAAPAVAAAPPQ